MIDSDEWTPRASTKFDQQHTLSSAVRTSADFKRVSALPRRNLSAWDASEVEKLTAPLYKAVRVDSGITKLKPIQAVALCEAQKAGGLVAPIGVGFGKTGVDILLCKMFPAVKKAVLLIPPGLQAQFIMRDYPAWAVNFNVPNLLEFDADTKSVVPVESAKKYWVEGNQELVLIKYSTLSQPYASDLLLKISPDMIICDEAHNLKNYRAARTARFKKALRVVRSRKKVVVCALSGTLTSKSLKDYAHLAEYALGQASPLPLEWNTLEEWCAALDPLERNAPAGCLLEWCAQGEDHRAGFSRRFTETLGVVATSGSSSEASILIDRLTTKIPKDVAALIKEVRTLGRRPDGEEADSDMMITAWQKELSCGFYHYYDFTGYDPDVVNVWFEARCNWNKECRNIIKRASNGVESPKNVEDLIAAGKLKTEYYEPWCQVEHLIKLSDVKRIKWVSDFFVEACKKIIEKAPPSLVWTEFPDLGARLAAALGTTFYNKKSQASLLMAEDGSRSIVLSIDSCSDGYNLQMYSRNIVLTPPVSAKIWQQLIGRTHRQGQAEDNVDVAVLVHSDVYEDSFKKALRDTKYVRDTMTTEMSLLQADYTEDMILKFFT